MRALRTWFARPRRKALTVSYVSRAALGWVVALPLVCAVDASGVGALPAADGALFEPGGLYLLELLYREQHALIAAAYASAVLLALSWIIRTAVTLLLFENARAPDAALKSSASRVLAELPRFLGLGGLELVLKVLVAGGAWLGVELLNSERSATSLFAQASQALLVLAFGVLVMAIAVLADACRAALLGSPRPSLLGSVDAGAALLWQRGPTLAGGWLLAFGAGVLGVAAAARFSEVLDVGRAGAWRVALVFVAHQAVVAMLCWIQAAWIGRVTQLNTDSPRARR